MKYKFFKINQQLNYIKMNHQRKRFNYLSTQQRALNSSNITETFNSKVGSIVSSNTKSQHEKQYTSVTQSYVRGNRNSQNKKQNQSVSELKQNVAQFDKRESASKVLGISNKQNIALSTRRQSFKDQKKQSNYVSSLNTSELQNKVTQLETEKFFLIKETEQKFLQMQKHLQKVQSILKEKQILIENLTNQNKRLDEQNQRWVEQSKLIVKENQRLTDQNKMLIDQNGLISSSRVDFNDEKDELLRMIADKNRQITRTNVQIQDLSKRQSELWTKINSLTEQNQNLKLKIESCIIEPSKILEQIDTQTQFHEQQSQIFSLKQCQAIQIQTDLHVSEIEQMIERCEQFSIDSKLNYRQKYESLFKRALQMEDQIYKLKEQLFDSQSQVKTIEQQFNTYKIFNQIEKIQQKN